MKEKLLLYFNAVEPVYFFLTNRLYWVVRGSVGHAVPVTGGEHCLHEEYPATGTTVPLQSELFHLHGLQPPQPGADSAQKWSSSQE